MTGFQLHPGTGVNALGETVPVVDLQAICRSIGAKVEVAETLTI
ncbi:MAG: hypothetical protein KAU38_11590 [Desulfobacterales bacterium]|nr:hypothetical protein [Desulfobacterales bacterium]